MVQGVCESTSFILIRMLSKLGFTLFESMIRGKLSEIPMSSPPRNLLDVSDCISCTWLVKDKIHRVQLFPKNVGILNQPLVLWKKQFRNFSQSMVQETNKSFLVLPLLWLNLWISIFMILPWICIRPVILHVYTLYCRGAKPVHLV
jgi:hypothetical protein